MCIRTKDLYHEQSEEDLVMSLMNEGSTREHAERMVSYYKDKAYWEGQHIIDEYFPEFSPKVAPI